MKKWFTFCSCLAVTCSNIGTMPFIDISDNILCDSPFRQLFIRDNTAFFKILALMAV